MNLEETTFEDAQSGFTNFLKENELNGPILWVFKEDIYSRRTDRFEVDFWLRLPLSAENEKFAKRHFELGKLRGFGLGLTAFASCEEGLCCSFLVPTDDEDAQWMLMGPQHLKYSFVSVDMPVAKVVRSKFIWRLFGLFPRLFRAGNHFGYLKSKSEIASDLLSF